ncbi:PAS domain S-box protein [Massilia aurea]|uniref:PAS domain S-box protein n=1 Tax=Massilia aurea TaxID=373040 RepID=UPI0027D97229|nr:PAS domain S-box protein [Massilia aurea]
MNDSSAFASMLGNSVAAKSILKHDWSVSELGGIEAWGPELRCAVAMVCRAPAAMALLWGPQGQLIYNDGYRKIVGDRHPTALGASAFSVWPEAVSFNCDVVSRVGKGESLSLRDVEFVLQRAGKAQSAWFDLDYSPVFDGQGAVIAALVLVIEKTDSIHANRQLELERATFVELFEQAPTFMALLRGPQHVFDRINPGYAKLVNHRSVIGKSVAEALPEAVEQGFVELLDSVFQSGEAFSGSSVEFSVQSAPDGPVDRRYLDFVYQPIRDFNGVVTSIFVEGVDVTDRELASAQIKRAEAQNRQILDSAIDYAIIAFDLNGKITQWNRGAWHVLGWSEQEMLGQDGSRFFTPEDRALDRMRIEMSCSLERGVGNDERWHIRKSGERFWASGEMTPLLDEQKQPVGFVKVLRDQTERHQSAKTLEDSLRRLDAAQEVGALGTYTVDVADGELQGSRGFFRIFGLDEQERIDATDIEALVISEDTLIRSSRESRADESAPLDVQYRIHRASDGAERWIARKAEFERDNVGAPLRMVGIVQDITERKTQELAVQESSAQFKTLAQALPNQVWTANVDGKLDWINRRLIDYVGARRIVKEGQSWVDFVHADDTANTLLLWEQSVASGAPFETEFRMQRHDGEYRWHLNRALPSHAPDGEISRWIGTLTDIHTNKVLEEQTKRDRNRMWTLSQELMLICSFEGNIAAVNPSATRLLGWSEEEMVGHSLGDFLHMDDIAATAAEVDKLGQGVTTLAFENRYRGKDGAFRTFDWTAVPDGGMIHAVGRDVTHERATEAALRQSQKLEAIGQLTGGVAHDFNNVLAVIRTAVDMMRLVKLTEERRERYVTAISDAVTRATKLTAQLLAFARRQALQPVVFDVNRNIQLVSAMIGSLTGARVAMVVDLAPMPCFVNADPSQFDTAIVNLAVNARDAMNGSGRLKITVSPVRQIPSVRGHDAVEGRFVAISMQDTGLGISADNLMKIFEPFFTTKGIGQGTGLGLSQVFGFAKQSGGEIDVKSELGSGSTFTMFLPQSGQTGASDADVEVANVVHGKGGCVLVVEDNGEVAKSVEMTLEELGYSTVTASSGEQALQILSNDATRFAVVFSDVVMGGMSGIDLGNEVQLLYPALPIVLSSGYSHMLANNPEHGFTLLSKPYSLTDLARILSDAIAGKQVGATISQSHKAALLPNVERNLDYGDMELFRQAELDSLQILDTDDEAAFDEVTRMAAEYCGVPIALISLIDADRQWFKSRVGLQARQTPREYAFCDHAIRLPGETMVVNDATVDQRFADNPLVTGDPNIRFYAGAPLVTQNGKAIGTLCVIDSVARKMDAGQIEMLELLAKRVVYLLERHRNTHSTTI